MSNDNILDNIKTNISHLTQGFPGGTMVKNLTANAGGVGSISGLGRVPGGGHGNSLHSCLETPTHRGPWQAKFHRVARDRTHAHKPFKGKTDN